MRGVRGVFIALEGIDAVGKKTQTRLLKSWLESEGLTARTLSFPAYETTIGKEIKKFLAGTVGYPPQVRAMLYAANRWEKKADLEATLSKNDVTIVNRYTGSNLAYGPSSGLGLEWLLGLEEGLPRPDLVLVLDAPPSMLVPRRGEKKDSYERNIRLQESARSAYLKLAARFGWTVIDADRGVVEVSKQIKSAVTKMLNSRSRGAKPFKTPRPSLKQA
jgi:dTMP kinase